MNYKTPYKTSHSRPEITMIFTDVLDMSLTTLSNRIVVALKNYTSNRMNEWGINICSW
jgi:hypothetical protein